MVDRFEVKPAVAIQGLFVLFGIDYAAQITVYRVIVFVLPVAFGVAAWRICKELTAGERVVAERHRAEAEARLARIKPPEAATEEV